MTPTIQPIPSTFITCRRKLPTTTKSSNPTSCHGGPNMIILRFKPSNCKLLMIKWLSKPPMMPINRQ
ncbi:hypothetical protein LguiA_009826 [Lonicera macranthoides]